MVLPVVVYTVHVLLYVVVVVVFVFVRATLCNSVELIVSNDVCLLLH